jgi:hypothetical protein
MVSAERAMRRQHAQAVLDGLHPTHCGDWPPALAARARYSALGRRHLARKAMQAVPAVWAPDQERWEAWQEQEPWLRWPHTRLTAFTRELGAIALGPALRLLVERNVVLFVRETLGIDHWRRSQSANPWREQAPEAVRHMGQAVLQRCGHDAAALSAAIDERGCIEFLGHAERAGPALAARLTGAYATPPASPCSKECWLPPHAVADLLRECTAQDRATLLASLDTQESFE